MNFSSSALFFNINFFQKILSGVCTMKVSVWIQTRPEFFAGLDLGPNCFQTSSADDTRQFPFPMVFAFHVFLNIHVSMMNTHVFIL